MKKTGVAAACLMAFMLSPGAWAQAPEIALPPLVTLPATWSFMGNGGPQALPGTCDIGTDAQKAEQGPAPYSVRCANNVLPSFGGARMGVNAAPYRGKRVRVSALLMASAIEAVPNEKYPNALGEAGLWIAVGARDGLKSNRLPDRTIKGSTGWEVRDVVVDIPADADRLQAGFWMQGKGQLWVRDLKVEEVPTTVAASWDRNAPKADAKPDLTLAPTAAPLPTDLFLPPPQRWLAIGAQNLALCDLGIDARLLAAGTRNLSIACPIALNANLRHTFEAAPWWGKRVRLSAWLKSENVVAGPDPGRRPGASMFLSTSADSNAVIYSVTVTGTTDWTQHEIVIDIPAGSPSPYIPMGLSLFGTGQFWARDLKFEEVSHDTPVTLIPAARNR